MKKVKQIERNFEEELYFLVYYVILVFYFSNYHPINCRYPMNFRPFILI